MHKSILSGVLFGLMGMSSMVVYAEAKKPLTAGEAQTIRIMAGATIGQVLQGAMNVNNLGIISNRSRICGTLVGGIGGGYLTKKGDANLVFESVATDEDAKIAVARIMDQEAVFLAFGGEFLRDDNVEILEQTLVALADANYQGTVVFHATTWAQQQPQDILKNNAKVASYLASAKLAAITLDIPNSQAALQKVTVTGTDVKLEEMGRVDLRDDLVALFRRA
ncbi:hypothetical protein [Thiomicrospira cyclica]|uniref:Uncharacterized protein n=1 Tax=Thiomicrospira cyclica (strain DSM 14477 / JCM 11371 / ALM1) TaxID=717773 RepID=F6DB12_THICA|nr:hypothetical protein [Thiomicrospira cyclica]AEG32345.1 hypothetical protein Thicy_1587 [Thiomicrospira cyclica ALM1]